MASKKAKYKRPSSAKRGYDYAWRKFRMEYLRKNPMCCRQGCREFATEVDHEPELEGPDDPGRLDESRCAPLCKSCHSSKTAKQTHSRADAEVQIEQRCIPLCVSQPLRLSLGSIRRRMKNAIVENLKPEDHTLFESLCQATALLDLAQREVAREPVVILNNGAYAANPMAKLIESNRKIVADLSARFGLSPLDRSKNSKATNGQTSTSEKEKEEFDAFLGTRPETIPMNREAS